MWATCLIWKEDGNPVASRYWELMGVWILCLKNRKLLVELVAGVGFEPTTFGL